MKTCITVITAYMFDISGTASDLGIFAWILLIVFFFMSIFIDAADCIKAIRYLEKIDKGD